MRVIVQRVTNAKVTVGEKLISSIGKGICVLVGISRDDKVQHMDYMVKKVLNLRVFEDDEDKRWNKSVMDKQLEVLCVSQFTLYHIMKGNKPDFHSAMGADESQEYYNQFLDKMKKSYSGDKIQTGEFGADMQVYIQNDGPVTITLESPDNLPAPKERKWPVKGEKSKGKAKAASSPAATDTSSNMDSSLTTDSSSTTTAAQTSEEQLAEQTEDLKIS